MAKIHPSCNHTIVKLSLISQISTITVHVMFYVCTYAVVKAQCGPSVIDYWLMEGQYLCISVALLCIVEDVGGRYDVGSQSYEI